ncbi:hypothetical protein P3T76_003538 [Phytophthora citrophthora]|uniref:Uncharacterized protein n=1 Tax=Phytophthora citrophthora TaxID=4793 RepID=A0AAD9LPR0_9STRA|nr:hypothetical protein P3T76_003538 [Phytophthora citrophthora]
MPFPPSKCRHKLWDIGHVLEKPYQKQGSNDGEVYTHICILCAQTLTCNPYASPNAWEGALHRWKHTSNVKRHMASQHKDHPVGQAEARWNLETATSHIEQAVEHARERDSKRSLPMVDSERATKRQGILRKAWYPSSREVGVYIAQ